MTTKTLRLNIDASGAASGAKQFNTAIGNTTKAINKMDAVAGSAFSKLSKEATKTFSSLSRSLGALSGNKLSGTLVTNLTKLSTAMKGFKPPSKTQVSNFRSFANVLKKLSINGRNFSKLSTLTAGLAGFRAPSKTQTSNLIAFINALNSLTITSRVTKLAADLERVARSATRASLALRRVNQNLGRARAPMRAFSSRAAKSAGAMRGLENAFDGTFQTASLFRGFIGAFTFATFARNIFDATIAVERFINLTNAISQSTGLGLDAEEQFKDIAAITRKLGGDLRVATEEYGKFSAAALNSGLSLEETKAIYKSLSGATTVLGLSTERTRLSFLAVTQILSKGRVSTEELRRQLGEQIPGLFESFSREVKRLAKTIGVEIDSLDDALRRGLISGEGGALILEKILREQFGPQVEEALQRADRRLNQLKSTFFELMVAIGRGGFLDALADSFVRIDETLRSDSFKEAATALGEKLSSAVRMLSDLFVVLLDNLDKVILGLKIFATIVSVGTFQRFALAMAGIAGPFISMAKVSGRFGAGLLGVGKGIKTAAPAASILSRALPIIATSLTIITGAAVLGGIAALALSLKRGAERTQDFKDGLLEIGRDEFTFGQRMSFALDGIINKLTTVIDKFTELRNLENKPTGKGGFLEALEDVFIDLPATAGFLAAGAIKKESLTRKRGTLQTQLAGAQKAGDFELIGRLSLELSAAEKELKTFSREFSASFSELMEKGIIDTVSGDVDKRLEQQLGFEEFQRKVKFARARLDSKDFAIEVTGALRGGRAQLTDEQLALRTFGSSKKAIETRNKGLAGLLNTMSPVLAITAKFNAQLKKLDDFQKKATDSQDLANETWAENERRMRSAQVAEKEIIASKREFFKILKEERALLDLSEVIETRQRQLQKLAEIEAARTSSRQLRSARLDVGEGTFSDAFQQQLDITRDAAGQWAQDVGSVMGNVFTDLSQGIGDAAAQILVFGADSTSTFKALGQQLLGSVVSGLVQVASQMLINFALENTIGAARASFAVAQLAIWQPLAAAVSLATAGTNAVGALAGMASVKAFSFFAKGGVFDKATAFSHSGGLGVMGEAGPEAVMPLRRDSQGRLGVAAAGGKKSEGNTVNIAIDARGAEQGVEEKIEEVLAEFLPLAMLQASDMAVIRVRNESGRRRI